MSKSEKVYIFLCVFFAALIILGNLTYQKFVSLDIPLVKHFELSVGAILYPLTFLITDLITEFYGKDRASFCVRNAIFVNIGVVLVVTIMDYLPATSWSRVDDATFHLLFGFYGMAFLCSIIACYIAQSVDIYLYLWIRRVTSGKYLWLRNNGSTSISLLIDTSIVISTLTIVGILPKAQMFDLILNSYSWKLFFTIMSTPLFYLSVFILKLAKLKPISV